MISNEIERTVLVSFLCYFCLFYCLFHWLLLVYFFYLFCVIFGLFVCYSCLELEEEKVAVVSLYPGIVKTEVMDNLMTKSPKDFEANVRDT